MDLLFIIADWLLFIGAAGGVAFAFSYAIFFRWTKTPAGRALLAFVVSLDVIFGLNLIGRFIGTEFAAWPILRIAAYLFTTVSMWTLVVTLWRGWRRITVEPSLKTRSNDTV